MVVDEGGYRSLYFDNQMIQSRMALEDPLRLILPYTRHMLACLLFNNHPQHILMVGLGGGSLAKFFLHHFPECRVEVVDSNPEMAAIARQFFFLPIDDRLTLYCADGEDFIATMAGRQPLYDLILIDAFDHDGMARSVYTHPFFRQIRPLLTHDGVLVLNVNRAEVGAYSPILTHITDCFSEASFRLPVPLPSHNEIIFCCKHKSATTHLTAPCQQMAGWTQQKPELDFIDWMQRMTLLKHITLPKQGIWRQWMDHLDRYRNRCSGP